MAKMPIRNKSKDNPYTLGFDEEKNIYTVEFKDNKNILHKVEISEKVYKAFDKFELEDISQIHKVRSHIEHSELCDETLNKRMINHNPGVDSIVEEQIIAEEIREGINKLSETQKRRIKMYYFDGLTQQQIADKEKASLRAVQYTLNDALTKLKEILKNLKN